MKFKVPNTLLFLIAIGPFFPGSVVVGQDSTNWKLEIGGTFSTFQQQVKAEVGDPRGERLVNETEVGLLLWGLTA